jgi:transposase
MVSHPTTRAFVQRQRDVGRSNPEILRILKRALARETFKHLTQPHHSLGIDDLRPTRRAKNITIAAAAAAAAALDLAPMTISRTERGMFLTPEVVHRYRDWLNAA